MPGPSVVLLSMKKGRKSTIQMPRIVFGLKLITPLVSVPTTAVCPLRPLELVRLLSLLLLLCVKGVFHIEHLLDSTRREPGDSRAGSTPPAHARRRA